MRVGTIKREISVSFVQMFLHNIVLTKSCIKLTMILKKAFVSVTENEQQTCITFGESCQFHRQLLYKRLNGFFTKLPTK